MTTTPPMPRSMANGMIAPATSNAAATTRQSTA